MSTDSILAVLDIGSTEIRAVVGRVLEPGKVEVIGFGAVPSVGISRGSVVDIEANTRVIQKAVEAAREKAGVFPQRVIVGVNGEGLKTFGASGTVAIMSKDRGITKDDINRVLRNAAERNVPVEHAVLDRIPCTFQVDQTTGVQDPVGKTGDLLAAEVFLVTCPRPVLADLERCIKGANLRVQKFVPTGLAASLAVLSDEEKNAGVALVDIGGGTTNVVVYFDGYVIHAEVLTKGGEGITRSIARSLTCSMETAAFLKKTYGVAMPEMVTPVETVPVKRLPPRQQKEIPRRVLSEIIEQGLDEILRDVGRVFHHRELTHRLFAGVILTGGGALLTGMKEKVENTLKIETHIGIPSRLEGFEMVFRNPRFASVAGLLEYASRDEVQQQTRAPFIFRLLERVAGLFGYL
ncbi:MAG TPA: cell division protein FtsA [bacterium]|nr:cell division protein FtsA [bacterium]